MKTDPSSNSIQAGPPPRLAYLLSIYPAISHTFFFNEITGLRRLGFVIDVASINRPELPGGLGSEPETNELKTTFYVKAMSPARIFLVLLKVLLRHPQVVFRAFRAALSLDPWNLRSMGYSLFYLVEALLLGDWLRQRGHTHLHIHFGGPVATVGMLAALAWQFSYSLMIHGPEEFYDVEKFYLRRKVEEASFVLCISDYCRSQVMKVCNPAYWSNLQVVRLGVDLTKFRPAPPADRRDVIEMVCVGRFVPAKGHLILLGAFASLRRRGYNLRLRLIGDGSERRRVEAFIARERLEGWVTLEGALNHEGTRKKLMNADIFVLASFAEGLPIALMEAMAMEIPCVSTWVAGIPELIRDGIDGLLVPPSSEDALTTALERLIADTDLRRTFARAGGQRVQEHYDLERNVRLLADTLENWLASSAKK